MNLGMVQIGQVADLNNQRYGPLGVGTQTAGLIAAGV